MHDAVRETLGDCKLMGGVGNSPYIFRCPICGDSKKNPNAKRGAVVHNRGDWNFVCLNECGSMSFLKFLKIYHHDVYKRLVIHGFTNDRKSYNKEPEKTEAEKTFIAAGETVFKPRELISILDNHPLAKKALNWAMGRKIRKIVYEQWYVCLEGNEFLDRDDRGGFIYTEKGYPKGNEYKNRVIIPYYRFGGKWSQFDARSLDPKAFVRYMNLKGADREPYNIEWLDVTKPFFLLEGCIDSTFIENAVAFGGTKHFHALLEQFPQILEHAHNGTVIWDNDDAGYDMIPVSIKMGFKWFNWSSIHPSDQFRKNSDGTNRVIKDINDLILYTELMERDEKEYIRYESLVPYIEDAKCGMIKVSLLYGDREAIKKEKQREAFMKMNENRILKETVKYNWE